LKDVHARRESFSFLRDRKAVSSLYDDIAPKVASRPGGYTRVVKLGQRQGDGAELAVLELVDYNLAQEAGAQKQTSKAAKTRRKKGAARAAKSETSGTKPAGAAEKAQESAVAETAPEKKSESGNAKKEDTKH
ncbi:MAG TPA: bL17 family ribosomal protein, partial [Bacteroidota bacterium]